MRLDEVGGPDGTGIWQAAGGAWHAPHPKCISIFHGNEVPRVYVNIPVRVHNQWRPYRVRADIRMSIRVGA